MAAISFPTIKTIEQLKSIVVNIVSEETKNDALDYLGKIRAAVKQLKVDVKALKKPYEDECDKIDAAAKPWLTTLKERDEAVEAAVLTYNEKMRKLVQQHNVKAMDRYETRVATKEAEAIKDGKPLPVVLPPSLKNEPAKTVHTEAGRSTESGYWTWDGLRGVEGGVKGAKDLTIVEARRLKLDLPEDWFVLDTAKVTACVKRNDRVPACVLNRFEGKIVVTAAKQVEV